MLCHGDKSADSKHRTYISFDTKDSAALVASMKRDGVNIGTCGVRTVRLRPMLIFEESHSKFGVVYRGDEWVIDCFS